MHEPDSGTLHVAGARLHYKLRGVGPLLLLIAGGAGDAETFDRISDEFVGRYRVLTYDRRGLARSPLDGPAHTIEIATHSDDVHRLLGALDGAPVLVFGSSIGAVIGLDLVLRHADQVRLLVAHEPPLMQLLSAGERPTVDMRAIARHEGGTAAVTAFAASIGVQSLGGAPEIASHAERGRRAADRAFFVAHEVEAVGRYRLDIATLRSVPTRIVVAAGEDGRSYFPYLCAERLAACLGTDLVEFPGRHAGYVSHPRTFAERLHAVLDDGGRTARGTVVIAAGVIAHASPRQSRRAGAVRASRRRLTALHCSGRAGPCCGRRSMPKRADSSPAR
jgi:pimeloyl-ACP methyl ester carboxylesterase